MIQWGTLCIMGANLLVSFITYVREKELISAGEQNMLASILSKQADDIAKASKAREDTRNHNAAVPANVSLPDDGFQRKD